MIVQYNDSFFLRKKATVFANFYVRLLLSLSFVIRFFHSHTINKNLCISTEEKKKRFPFPDIDYLCKRWLLL